MPPNARELGLYIHIPWCIRKCPYCDFNSHAKPTSGLPEMEYLDALLADLEQEAPHVQERIVTSIFIGGGTPSLVSGDFIAQLIARVKAVLNVADLVEITLEANPGTFELNKFKDFKHAGVNRLSIGVQSFDNTQLKNLGRIHGSDEAKEALNAAHEAGFKQINCDLMYNLPGQTVEEAVLDIQTAMSFQPSHLSWYHLTIEPNTEFYRNPPVVPGDEETIRIESQCLALLANNNYQRYEISAFAKPGARCRHNLNYWQFGDYLGIGAGAHGKISDASGKVITRYCKYRTPTRYMSQTKSYVANSWQLNDKDKKYEFMLNALRLVDGFNLGLFTRATGLDRATIQSSLEQAQAKSLVEVTNDALRPSAFGLRFLNDLINQFSD